MAKVLIVWPKCTKYASLIESKNHYVQYLCVLGLSLVHYLFQGENSITLISDIGDENTKYVFVPKGT